MMKLWISLILIFLIQEAASTTAVIFRATQEHIGFWALLLTWTIMTALGVYIGYFLGKKTRSRIEKTRTGIYVEKLAQTIEGYIGKRGENFVIIFITLVNFVYINAFLCAWLKIDFKRMLILMVLANTLNFLLVWEAVTHAHTLFSNSFIALIVAILIIIGVLTISRAIFQKMVKH